MSDPISRLELAREEIDRVFGSGHARQHPEVATKLSVEFNRPVSVEVSEDGECGAEVTVRGGMLEVVV